ncbi:MAG TPA: hypothetical protein VHT05_07190 [Candidatus Elarobacter sp.]|nr:hypothetical protein [Candidatus Elarobacter sp.]
MRRLALAVVVAAMMVISGCGRQVTGLNIPGNGIVPAGYSLVRFETAGQLDFQNVSYLIVFNTSGNNQQPYAQGFNTDFKNWSLYFIVGGGANFANAPGLEEIYQNPASGASQAFNVVYPTTIVNFQPSIPSGNAQFGFQITFNRCVFDLAPPTSTPPPTTGTSTGDCPPFLNNTTIGTNWNVSLFTLDRTLTAIDSLSVNGPAATDYSFSYNITQTIPSGSNSGQYFKPANNVTVNNPAAQIVGIEVFNTP